MGKIKEKIKLTNFADLKMAERSFIPFEEVRSLELEMIVDTGSAMTVIGEDVAKQLGLKKTSPIIMQRSGDSAQKHFKDYGIFIEFEGRDCVTDCIILEKGVTPLLGQIPLIEMDFLIDLKNQKLIPNPESFDDIPVVSAQ